MLCQDLIYIFITYKLNNCAVLEGLRVYVRVPHLAAHAESRNPSNTSQLYSLYQHFVLHSLTCILLSKDQYYVIAYDTLKFGWNFVVYKHYAIILPAIH